MPQIGPVDVRYQGGPWDGAVEHKPLLDRPEPGRGRNYDLDHPMPIGGVNPPVDGRRHIYTFVPDQDERVGVIVSGRMVYEGWQDIPA